MYIRALVPCDAILENPDGSFDLKRAGINELVAPHFPAQMNFAVLLRLELDDDEALKLHWARISVSHAGVPLLPDVPTPLVVRNRVPGQPCYLNLFMRFNLELAGPGELQLSGRIDDEVAFPTMRLFASLGTADGSSAH